MTGPILVTGARAPVAIDIARAFRAAGHRVTLADSVAAIGARWTRGVDTLRLPPPRFAFDSFARALADWIATHAPRLIVPTCEEVFYVAAAAERHGFADRVFAPPLTVLRRLHSKIAFADVLREAGLTGPDTWPIASLADLAALNLRPEQLVLKPEFSRFGTATLIRPTAKAIATMRFAPGQRWAAQRYVAGEEVCLWTAAIDGLIVAHAAYRPCWRHGRAAAYAFAPVEDDAALVAPARAIAAALNITGQMSFDLMVTPDGAVRPIECNPRAVSGVHLFDAGPGLARALLGDGTAQATAGLRYLAPAMLALGLPQALASSRLGEWRRDWTRGRDALGRTGDRWPALGALADAARFAAVGLSRGRSAAGQTTDDIEWNGEPIG